MSEFEGNLLIGGMKLSHIHGELEKEAPDSESDDWSFAGRLLLAAQECGCLECQRLYRLELADGRAGQVIVSRLEATDGAHFVAEFQPQQANGTDSNTSEGNSHSRPR